MFDHLADSNPPIDTSHVRQRINYHLHRRQKRRIIGSAVGATAVAATIGLVAASTSGGNGANVIVGGSPALSGGRPFPDASFLTVAPIQPHVEHSQVAHRHYQYTTYNRIELQERNLGTGNIEAVLMRVSSKDEISASFLPDGDVLAAVSLSPACGATLTSIDPSNGSAKTLAHLSDSIEGLTGLTVSPTGKFVAYIAYPGCQGGTPIPTTTEVANSAAPKTTVPASNSDYIAVRNLQTGATQEAPYPEQGNATSGAGPVWSPDGTHLAIMSRSTTTMILSAVGPTLYDTKILPAPSRCTISDIGAWTAAGITESLDCEAKLVGRYNPQNPPKEWTVLEQVLPSGRTSNSLKLSTCDSVNSIESSTPGSPAIVDALNTYPASVINHCSAPATRIATYTNGHLHTIITVKISQLEMPD